MASPRKSTQLVFESTSAPSVPNPRVPLVTERFFGEALADAVQTRSDFESLEVPWHRHKESEPQLDAASPLEALHDGRRYPMPPPTTKEVLTSLLALEDKAASLETKVRGLHFAPMLVSDMERIMQDYAENSAKHNRSVETLEHKVDNLLQLVKTIGGTGAALVDPQQASQCCSQLRAVRPMKDVMELAVRNITALEALEQEWPTIKASAERGLALNLKRKRELDRLEATVAAMEAQVGVAETTVESMFAAFRKEFDGIL